jgi:hypothetical protein
VYSGFFPFRDIERNLRGCGIGSAVAECFT